MGSDRFAGVVLASRGYPESSASGQPIEGIDEAEAIPGVEVYHAGTAQRGRQIVTAGGRVLTVVGRGADFAEAISRAYTGVLHIRFEGMQYRHDIGRKALKFQMMKYAVVTFGCRVNQADSLGFEEELLAAGAVAAVAAGCGSSSS